MVGFARSTTVIEVQGARAVERHWEGIAILTGEMAAAVTGVAGVYLANLAKEIHRPNILTGATFRSISAAEGRQGGFTLIPDGDGVSVDVGTIDDGGPDSPVPQARLIEFGFHHVGSGGFIQFPFMIPAGNLTEPIFVDAMVQVARLADSLIFPTGRIMNDPAVQDPMQRLRGFLYSHSKFLGDIQVFSQSPLIGKTRGFMLAGARGIGDLQAGMRGAIASRITHRVVGRFTGAGISTSRSAIVSGPDSGFQSGAQRIYNRMAGRGIGIGLQRGL